MRVELGEEEVLQSDVLVPAPDGERAADRPKGDAACKTWVQSRFNHSSSWIV